MRDPDVMTAGEAMRLAQTMHAGGWSVIEIQRYLASNGVERSWPTVKRWAIPEFNERELERVRGRMRNSWAASTPGRLGRRGDTPEYQEARAQGLRRRGMLQTQIALVMDFDYPGQGWTRGRVERLLGSARPAHQEEAA